VSLARLVQASGISASSFLNYGPTNFVPLRDDASHDPSFRSCDVWKAHLIPFKHYAIHTVRRGYAASISISACVRTGT
jgi:hypothetical protein